MKVGFLLIFKHLIGYIYIVHLMYVVEFIASSLHLSHTLMYITIIAGSVNVSLMLPKHRSLCKKRIISLPIMFDAFAILLC